MKLTATQYAKTLYEITKGKSSSEIDEALVNFVKLLIKNNQIKFADGIISRFKKISNAEEGITEAEIMSREKLSSEIEDRIGGFIKEKYQTEKVVINNKIDEKILGGIIIRVGDEVMDGSLRNQLRNMKLALKN